MSLYNSPPAIDKTWTLFLDRDGVINVEVPGTYVTNWEEFTFCDGVLVSMNMLHEMFGRIVVVTNQRGVGRGIMSMDDLRYINVNMRQAIEDAGGRLDHIYACTAVEDNDHNRKPQTGMGLQAREDFPEIDFKKSIILGNSMSDMQFGKRLGMHTVFLTTKHEPYELPHDMIDEQFDSLKAWTETLVGDVVLG